jgi:hypothetical protein
MMTRYFKRTVAALSCAALLGTSLPAVADEIRARDDGAYMLADLFLVRPIGLVGSVLGAAVFVVSLPFTLPTGSTGDAAKELLGKPLEYTFNRPLGEFDYCGADRHTCGNF